MASRILWALLLLAACGDDEALFCTPGDARACYTGPLGTLGVGACASGTQTCLPDGTAYAACTSEVLPAARDTCTAPASDDDCSGEAGDSCPCDPGANVPCGTELPGPCHQGVMTCGPDGTGYGECVGAVDPVPEDCENAEDDDCDGTVNDGCP